MATFIAILKIVLLSTLGSAVLAVISGRLYASSTTGHPHEIIPMWMFIGAVGAVIGFGISLICSLIFRNSLDTNIIKSIVIATVTSEIFILILLVYMSFR